MKRGLSLVEVIVAFAVVSLVLLTIARLVTSYSQLSRHSVAKDRALRSMLTGLDLMERDVSGAVEVLIPAPLASGGVLEYYRILPDSPGRLPTAVPNPIPQSLHSPWWDPYPNNSLMLVRYYLDGETLLRQIDIPGQAVATHVAAEGLTGFEADRSLDQTLLIRCTFRDGERLRPTTTRVLLRALSQGPL